MNNDLAIRVQNITNRMEALKVKKIEEETNAKRYESDLNECLEKLKELGYEDINSAEEAVKNLESLLVSECNELEQRFNEINV